MVKMFIILELWINQDVIQCVLNINSVVIKLAIKMYSIYIKYVYKPFIYYRYIYMLISDLKESRKW